MAIDLTGKIKQAAKITTKCQLQNEAADALDKMAEAYKTEKGKDLVVKSGYVSPYDLIGELSGKANWGILPDGESKVKKVTDAMASNGTLTEDDIKAALDALDGADYEVAQFETLHAMQSGTISYLHPTLKKDGRIYGWPNKPKFDPRRSGLVIVVPSDVDQINWMVANGYKYGWLYYTGPFDTYVYTNPANIPQDQWLAKASSKWGIQIVAAKIQMATNYQREITQEDIDSFKNSKQSQANNAIDSGWTGTTYKDDWYRMNPDYYLWKWTWTDWTAKR
jgi:hypothetical protein